MKKIAYVIALLLSFSIITSSCKKKQGCTDATAINFDASAEQNNNSCIYKGNVTFWNDVASSLGYVTVTMADGTTGVITADYSSAPSCGASRCFNYSNVPGTYSYTAVEAAPGLHTWSGSVAITSDGCVTVRLY